MDAAAQFYPGPTDGPTRIKVWGVRGSVPTPGPSTVFYGGNTSCIEVRAAEEIIILDAGTGIRPLGLALEKEFQGRSLDLTLLITHTHWDHIQGFPFFLPAYNPRNKLRIVGYDGARTGLTTTLSGQMENPYFPVSLKQMPGNIVIDELTKMKFSVGPVQVRAALMNHPGLCVGYHLFTPHGSVAYLPDNELVNMNSNSGTGLEPDRLPPGYAADRQERLADFIQGADVLIMDSQYDASEYPRHIGWGHSCVTDTVSLAVQANVKRLLLFHHDPDHDDAHLNRMVRSAREIVAEKGSQLAVEAAREGVEIVLDGTGHH